jgi:hypothetical protein
MSSILRVEGTIRSSVRLMSQALARSCPTREHPQA